MLVPLVAFTATVWLSNWATARFGLVELAPGLAVTAGTFTAGLSFGLRDALQERGGRWWATIGILVGAALSARLGGALALASATAFLVSEMADLVVYTPLRLRRWVLAVAASNLVGAAVDTVVFLSLAGFPVSAAFAGQMLVKGAMIAPSLLVVRWLRR